MTREEIERRWQEAFEVFCRFGINRWYYVRARMALDEMSDLDHLRVQLDFPQVYA